MQSVEEKTRKFARFRIGNGQRIHQLIRDIRHNLTKHCQQSLLLISQLIHTYTCTSTVPMPQLLVVIGTGFS